MFKAQDGGFHNFADGEVEQAIKDDWVPGEGIRQKLLEAKRGIAKQEEVDTIPAQPEVKRSPGRPRKEVPSVLNDGEV
jgi:hypothetical protein